MCLWQAVDNVDRLQSLRYEVIGLFFCQWVINVSQRCIQITMAQQFPYTVQRNAFRVQITGKRFSHFMRGFRSQSLTLCVFFQYIGDLPGCNAVPIPHKKVLAGSLDFLHEGHCLGDENNEAVTVRLCMLYYLVLVCILVSYFLTDYMQMVLLISIAVVFPF